MNTKEVRFDVYCKTCKNYEKRESEDPCFDCLNQGWNEDSHKPIYYDEDEKAAKKNGYSEAKV